MSKPVLKIATPREKIRQEQDKFAVDALDNKKKGGKLTLEDVYDLNRLILKQLQELGVKSRG